MAATCAWPASTRAEIELTARDGWVLTTDGRVNSFVSHARGTGIPDMTPDFTGVDDEKDKDGRIESTRLRNGFIASVLALNLTRRVTDRLNVRARVGFWMIPASTRSKSDLPPVDVRELFVKLEGPWGSLLAGRDMSLFARGAIMMNYEFGHIYGMGHPCSTQIVIGGACGHAGHGTPFPGFNSGLVYSTPPAKLQVSAGIYDPSTIPVGQFERTPLPRAEAEVNLRPGKAFRVFASGFWQTLSKTRPDPVTMKLADLAVDASGGSAGLALELGVLRLGGAAYAGTGIGPYLPIENNPSTVDEQGVLRSSHGYYGQAALVFTAVQLSAGLGVSRIDKTENDADPEKAGNPRLIAQQLGGSLGFYYRFAPVVFALEYFRAEYQWHEYGEVVEDDIVIKRPQQAVDFFNAGITLPW